MLYFAVFAAGFYAGVTVMCLLFMARKGDADGENLLSRMERNRETEQPRD